MKFSCTRDNLANALSLVSGIVSKNSNLPILNNVLIKVDSQKVEIVSTNLDLATTVTIRAKTDEPGSFTVPARTLNDFIGLLSGDKVDLELKNDELTVFCGKSSTKIKGSSAEEFPIIPILSEGRGFLVEARALKDGLAQVLTAVARNDIRPELSGVFFGFNLNSQPELILAATDSYRLAEKKIPLPQGQGELKIILPGRAAQEINHLLSAGGEEAEKDVRILVSDNQLAIHFGNIQMTSRLVDGQYPDYAQIIPKHFKTTMRFSVNQIAKEIKAASLFTTTGVNAVSLTFQPKDSALVLSSASTQTGEHRSEVPVEIEGEENTVLLSHRYFLDGLNNLNTENAVLKIINSDSPCVLYPEGDQSFLYIIMPIRQ